MKRVRNARHWPENVDEYQKMMDERAIEFTAKDDSDKVAYLFFKMSFDLSAAQRGQPTRFRRWRPRGVLSPRIGRDWVTDQVYVK